jgi:hypothetical protein
VVYRANAEDIREAQDLERSRCLHTEMKGRGVPASRRPRQVSLGRFSACRLRSGARPLKRVRRGVTRCIAVVFVGGVIVAVAVAIVVVAVGLGIARAVCATRWRTRRSMTASGHATSTFSLISASAKGRRDKRKSVAYMCGWAVEDGFTAVWKK